MLKIAFEKGYYQDDFNYELSLSKQQKEDQEEGEQIDSNKDKENTLGKCVPGIIKQNKLTIKVSVCLREPLFIPFKKRDYKSCMNEIGEKIDSLNILNLNNKNFKERLTLMYKG